MARLQSDQSIIQCHSFTSALVHFAGVQVARLTSCAGESAAHPLIFVALFWLCQSGAQKTII